MYKKEDVTRLLADVGKMVKEPDLSALEMGEPSHFGLTVHAYDPVSGEVFVVCRPHIAQIGQSEIFLTPNQLATAVAEARVNRLHRDRAMGIVAPLTKTQRDAALQARKEASTDAQKAQAVQAPSVQPRPNPVP